MDRIKELSQFLAENPHDEFVIYAMGLEYFRIFDDEKAQSYWQKLLDESPDYLPVYYMYALLLQRNGKIADAQVVVNRGMELCRRKGERSTLAELSALWEDLEDMES